MCWKAVFCQKRSSSKPWSSLDVETETHNLSFHSFVYLLNRIANEFHAVGIFPPGQHQSHQAEALRKRGANVGFCSSASVTNGNKWQRMTEDVSDGENYMEILSDTVMLSTRQVLCRIVCFVWSSAAEMNLETSKYDGWPTLFWSCNASCVLTVEKKRQVFTVKMFGNESLISFRGESEQFLESRGRSDT